MKSQISKKFYLSFICAILLSISLLTACGEKVQQTSAIPYPPQTATMVSPIPSKIPMPTSTVAPTSTSAPTTTPKQTAVPTKQVEKEQIVYIGKTGNKYHIAGCRTLKGNDIPISLTEALKEGREPCKVCH